MSDARRHVYNIGKLALMAVFSVVGLAAIAIIFVWPLTFYTHFGQPISVSLALCVVLVVAWLIANS